MQLRDQRYRAARNACARLVSPRRSARAQSDEAERMLEAVKAEHVHVFYTRSPIEFGLTGESEAAPKPTHRSFLRRPAH